MDFFSQPHSVTCFLFESPFGCIIFLIYVTPSDSLIFKLHFQMYISSNLLFLSLFSKCIYSNHTSKVYYCYYPFQAFFFHLLIPVSPHLDPKTISGNVGGMLKS